MKAYVFLLVFPIIVISSVILTLGCTKEPEVPDLSCDKVWNVVITYNNSNVDSAQITSCRQPRIKCGEGSCCLYYSPLNVANDRIWSCYIREIDFYEKE